MNLSELLEQLSDDPHADIDLAEAALSIAVDEYPRLDIPRYMNQIDRLADEGRPLAARSLADQVAALSRFLFYHVGFRGNRQHYYDPRNSYLNEVLDRRTGIPISLSLITLAIGRRWGLAIHGVALPGHFVVMAEHDGERIVFDPYHQGELLDTTDCEHLVLNSAGIEMSLGSLYDLEPASPAAIVTRVLNNLKGCYLRLRDFPRAIRVIQRLRQITPDDHVQLRDLGACWMRLGHPGRAIDPLEMYLRRKPDGEDHEAVIKLLQAARSELAQWN